MTFAFKRGTLMKNPSREKMDPFEIVTSDFRLRFRRDLEELQTDLAKATSANAYCWIKKGNITKALAVDSKRSLDIGCGWGRELNLLPNSVGIDICLPFLRTAKNYTNNDVVLATIDFLPFREDAFDLIVMSEVIEHLENAQNAMKEAFRVLQNKGKLILQTPNKQITKQKVVAEKYGHVHEFSLKELFRFLSDFNFQVMGWLSSTIPYIPSSSRLAMLDGNVVFFKIWKLLDKLCPLKWDIIIFAQLFKTRNIVNES